MSHSFSYFPKDTFETLEFDKIIQILEDNCLSNLGIKILHQNNFSTDIDELNFKLKQVFEMKSIIQNGQKFPQQNYFDLSDELKALSITNNIIEGKQFRRILACANTIDEIDQFFVKHKEEFPYLKSIIDTVKTDKSIITEIDKIIDEDGDIRSNASKELQTIRQNIISKSKAIQRVFGSILSKLKEKNQLAETEESIRNGRRVLSIQAENKRSVNGIIHDESDSGKISYIEPQETVLLNNELFELERDEKREIYKILKQLSNSIAQKIPTLNIYQKTLGKYDFIRAKALFAIKINAEMPLLNNNGILNLKEAYHPLLFIKNSNVKKEVVPFSVLLNAEKHILLISGPNAGGKSVTLKSIALIQLMVQFGLLTPCNEHSKICLFSSFFVDVGDKQSIENELSTYSSRLQQMKYFLEKANAKTIYFIDEFGTGTDPKLGAAMAEAIMLNLAHTKAFGVITTHYSNLKKVAEQDERFLNAAMIFNENTLSPTFQLQTGKPGSSFTFAIAKKTGLSNTLINEAKELVDYSDLKFEDLLQKVEQERKKLEKENHKIRIENKRLKELVVKFEKLNNEVQHKQENLRIQLHELEKTKNKAVEQKINEVLNEINNAKSKKIAAQKIKELTEAKAEILTKKDKIIPAFKKVSTQNFFVGDIVLMNESDNEGEILEIRGKNAVVAFNGLKTTIPLKKLSKIITEETPKEQNNNKNYSLRNEVENEFDIRGLMQYEASVQIESYIDQALLNNLKTIKIIHGKGSGALRTQLQNIIKEYRSNIAEWRFEDEKKGGNGATIITFK
ncbi:MAG: Smr/MutS family protein [Chitinophagales bacterium]